MIAFVLQGKSQKENKKKKMHSESHEEHINFNKIGRTYLLLLVKKLY